MFKIKALLLTAVIFSAMFFVALGFVYPHLSFATQPTIELTPVTKTMKKGESLSLQIVINPEENPISKANVTLSYPNDLLAITLFVPGTLLPNKASWSGYDNNRGIFSWGAFADDEGVKDSGVFGVVTFKALEDGIARVQVTNSSQLVTSTGETIGSYGASTILIGTGGVRPMVPIDVLDVPDSTDPVAMEPINAPEISETTPSPSSPVAGGSESVRLEAPPMPDGLPPVPTVSSTTHPDQAAWYSQRDALFTVTRTSDIAGVNVLADQNPTTNPGTTSDGLRSQFSYDNVRDGVWYLHTRLQNQHQ